MTVAALALALALLVAPQPSRRGIVACGPSLNPRRLKLPCGAALVAVAAVAAPLAVVVAALLVGATVAIRHRRRLRSQRRGTEAAALQAALDVLVGELRVGAHPVAALEIAAGEVDDVVADALRTVAARARMGADVAAGLRSAAARSSLPAHWHRLAVCWQLAQTHGLAIATLMQTAQRDVVERERFTSRVDAGMAGARTTAAVLAGLPVLGIVLGQAVGANPVGFLISGGAGGWLLLIGVALSCTGLLWSDTITGRALK